jgi:hypothetical protein
MNEAELVAAAIQDVKDRGYSSSYLTDPDTMKHCVLGSIGFARWGDQWDIDCSRFGEGSEMYSRLQRDTLTRGLIKRVSEAISAKDPELMEKYDSPSTFSSVYEGEYFNCLVYDWNDELVDKLGSDTAGQQELLEVLEKVQAEIGVAG